MFLAQPLREISKSILWNSYVLIWDVANCFKYQNNDRMNFVGWGNKKQKQKLPSIWTSGADWKSVLSATQSTSN